MTAQWFRTGSRTLAGGAVLVATVAIALTGCSSAPLASVAPRASATVSVGAPTPAAPTEIPTTGPSKTVAPAQVPDVGSHVNIVPPPRFPPRAPAYAAVTPPSTLVVRISAPTTVYVAPGGKREGVIQPTTRSALTWIPVLVARPDQWTQIRWRDGLKLRTGWSRVNASQLADTGGWVEIRLAAKTLTIREGGKPARTWPLKAIGGGRYPTPTGLFWTERVGASDNPNSVYGTGPFVELSARSTTYLEAPIIAVHSWNRRLARNEFSHGCARAPDAAVNAVAQLPLSAPVLIRP